MIIEMDITWYCWTNKVCHVKNRYNMYLILLLSMGGGIGGWEGKGGRV